MELLDPGANRRLTADGSDYMLVALPGSIESRPLPRERTSDRLSNRRELLLENRLA